MIDVQKTYRSRSRTSKIVLQSDPGQSRLIGLYGPSGVGKTTVLKVLAGLEDAEPNQSIINGKTIQSYQKEKAIAIVFQDAYLPKNLSVEQVLDLFTNDSNARKDAIHDLGIQSLMKEKIKNLSQGQRQRVAILTCLFSDKSLLLLDEPFSAIGDDQISLVCELITTQTRANQSKIVLISSHRKDVLGKLCTKLIEMKTP